MIGAASARRGALKDILVLAVLLVVGIGLAMAFGVFDPRRTSLQAQALVGSTRNAVASAVAGNPDRAPGLGGAKAAATCRANIRRIEGAKRVAAQKKGDAVGAVSWDEVLKELRGKKPVCPVGGTYLLGDQKVLCKCSITGNGTTERDDDHMIDQY